MSVDDTKISYSSTWDIDQLVATGTTAVGAGDTSLYLISGLPSLPVFEVQFQPTGSSKWYQAGMYSTDNTVANLVTAYSYISGNHIFINAPTGGSARCYVWSDKIDY